ncbi:predicted protein [Plenodomus lingam JN3]|uniref:Predicted protein n=1 Tax=Leptosphaeria maculans (strain JN3 / isolate v23.1.3 / race Av1-4-5-6-7-8) TaxID=985895 RepID=E5R569_LEPMJ|nr:predicted protein [Plenodomus lingam JN3]CBX92039.1 predicted protein [Plenodomus lingam JN3]
MDRYCRLCHMQSAICKLRSDYNYPTLNQHGTGGGDGRLNDTLTVTLLSQGKDWGCLRPPVFYAVTTPRHWSGDVTFVLYVKQTHPVPSPSTHT